MQLFGYNLFQKADEKKSYETAGNSLSVLMGNQYEEKPMNFNTYYDMYSRNADIKSCVNEIQKTAGKSGFKVFKKTGVGENGEIQYKEISDNIFVRNFLNISAEVKVPGVDDWGAFNRLKKEILKHKKISGNIFLLKRRNPIGKLVWVKVFDTRNVSIVTDPYLKVIYYMVRQGASVSQVSPENMFHFYNTTDVRDEVYGGSELSGIIYHAYADNEASISNYFAMLNNSVPAWLYVLKEGVEIESAKAIMTEVKNAVTGSKNRNKSIVSNAIQDFKQMANNHKDMDFVAMQAFNSEKICSALGVPRVVLNYTEGVQVGNGETQYKKYIENTIRPEEMELNYIFTTILGEILPDVWFQVIDEHINDRKDKLDIVEKAINIGVYTRNEAREYLGDTKIEDNDLMDKYTVQNNVKLIEDLEFSITDMQNEQTSNIPT